MAEYVKDFSEQKNESKKKFSFAKLFLILFVILLAFGIFVFPHESCISYTADGKTVVAVNSITHIGYYLDYDLVIENKDGKMERKWILKDKDILSFVKQEELGEDVYYNEEKGILIELDGNNNQEEMSVQEIFFKVIFG